jgi:hypothetical protein
MRCKILVLAVICLGILTGLAYHFASSQAPPAEKSGRAAQLLRLAWPHLEAALAAKLVQPPVVREVSSAAITQLPDWELRGYIAWRFPSMRGEALDRAYQLAHRVDCRATVARHPEGTDFIAVAPEQLSYLARLNPTLKDVDCDAFLQLALVHEAARYALEQRHQLIDRRFDPRSVEELKILQAVREGRAQWLTREVARRLGTERFFPLLARSWRCVPDSAPDAQLKEICQTWLRQKYWACTQGVAFFDHLQQSGLKDVESTVFAHLPRQATWIDHPSSYLQHGITKGEDLRALFADIEKHNSPAGCHAAQQPWTPAMIVRVAALVDMTKRAEQLTQGWQDGRTLIWTHPDRSLGYIALTVVRFSSDQAARAYYGFALDLRGQRDQLSPKTTGVPQEILSSRFTKPPQLPGVEEISQYEKVLEIRLSVPGHFNQKLILARSGSTVVELDIQAMDCDSGWTATILQRFVAKGRQ